MEVQFNYSRYDEKDILKKQGLCTRCGQSPWNWMVQEIWCSGLNFLCNECNECEGEIRSKWVSFERAYEKGILFFREHNWQVRDDITYKEIFWKFAERQNNVKECY